PDYVLVSESRLQPMVAALARAAKRFYADPGRNDDYTAIITRRHRQRLIALRDEAENHGCRVIEIDASAEQLEASGKLPPTLIVNPHRGLRIMQEEIFGPLLPVIGIRDFDAALAYIGRQPHPLALYAFTHDTQHHEKLLQNTRSGGLVINDTLWHVAQETLPFGGTGASGMGAYHGERGFVTFSHERSVLRQSRRSAVTLLNPPYRRWLLRLLRLI
ncbi:MAG: aldehyde dehydrogenase family protein, partial [Halomonas sp.]|nr:aldehyde dehydrogenase family protein [Halomonas sp.]